MDETPEQRIARARAEALQSPASICKRFELAVALLELGRLEDAERECLEALNVPGASFAETGRLARACRSGVVETLLRSLYRQRKYRPLLAVARRVVEAGEIAWDEVAVLWAMSASYLQSDAPGAAETLAALEAANAEPIRRGTPVVIAARFKFLVEADKLIDPDDDLAAAFENLPKTAETRFTTAGEPFFVSDPQALGVWEARGDEAGFWCERAAFATNFGGDTNCPVFWHEPYALLATCRGDRPLCVPPAAKLLAPAVWTDSGSFVFLPLRHDLPTSVAERITSGRRENVGATLALPAGTYQVRYEQHDGPPPYHHTAYRNIVLHRIG